MRPRIAMTMGDPCGIGPELVARLLANEENRLLADVILIGDEWVREQGQKVAQLPFDVHTIDHIGEAQFAPGMPEFLRHDTVRQDDMTVAVESAAGGRSVLANLDVALDLARSGSADAICFAPLNKHAMHLAGMPYSDELHWFADKLAHTGPVSEFNVLEELWTSRVTSHIALKDVSDNIDEAGIVEAIKLANTALRKAGHDRPRIGVAALNPHAGDNGSFGREEIDVIAPAVRTAQSMQIDVQGPYPADTIFLRARDGDYDVIVTMYHDQGQIAMKLMGFDRGVTVQGGLPVPIATPAHGTAFDIAGRGVANPDAIGNAFKIAANMGATRRAERDGTGQ